MVDKAGNTIMSQYQLQLKLLKIYTDMLFIAANKYRSADLVKSQLMGIRLGTGR